MSVLGAQGARADVIKCFFTEPFVHMTYSTTQSRLTILRDFEKQTEVVPNVSLQIVGPAKLELWNAANKPILRLNVDGGGSDGMSDRVFPYSVEWLPSKQYGGCTSNHLPASGN